MTAVLTIVILLTLWKSSSGSNSIASKFTATAAITDAKESQESSKYSPTKSGVIIITDNQNVAETRKKIKLASYFVLWYAVTLIYSTVNKIVLNQLPLPVTLGVAQLFLGIPVFLPLWLLNRPKATKEELNAIAKISTMHGLGNVVSVVSLGAGAVSFTHVIKAAEPVFAAALSVIFLGNVFPNYVYLTLLPVILGVSFASLKELSFTWLGFSSAMASNAFNQLRIIWAKKELNSSTMSAATLYQIMTFFAAFELLPLVWLAEGSIIRSTWQKAIASGIQEKNLLFNIFISGITHYMSNEIAFWILELVHPVTHAVGNTIKRIVLILGSVLFFRTPMTIQGIIGSAIAILGTLLYSLAIQKASDSKRSIPAAKS